MSMAKRCSMAETATMLVGTREDRAAVDQAKLLLMKRYRINESAAYRRLRCCYETMKGKCCGQCSRERVKC